MKVQHTISPERRARNEQIKTNELFDVQITDVDQWVDDNITSIADVKAVMNTLIKMIKAVEPQE